MSEEPRRRRSREWIGWALLAAFVLYPLSVGPVYRILLVRDVDLDTLNRVYAPVWWVWHSSDSAYQLINWSMRLWGIN